MLKRSIQKNKNSFHYIIFAFLFLILSALAFLPGDFLISTPHFRDIIFDSLHIPAAWISYKAFRFYLPFRSSVFLLFFAIAFVEIAQYHLGREASFIDIGLGLIGLSLGIVHNFNIKMSHKTIAMGILLFIGFTPLITQSIIRIDHINSFPELDQFHKTSTRMYWKPLPDQNNTIIFVNSKNKTTDMVIYKENNGYWGAAMKLFPVENRVAFSKLQFCFYTEKEDTLQIRIDDRQAPAFHERINFSIKTQPKRSCSTLDLEQEANRLKQLENHEPPYDLHRIEKLGLFLDPDSESNWIRIETIYFSP